MTDAQTAVGHARQWWKEATIYQIYPSSFIDSNGDGMGDIAGIITKIPYIASLGVDCIWLSPHYMSPQEDMGYDISDYENIYPPYGTLDQCQQLIDTCHSHGLKIIFDLVINHTSAEHAWFQESRSSRTNSKRNYYFWKPPSGWTDDGKPIPPNNWRSIFGGSAWEFDEQTQEYYLHLFAPRMPDLNWENESTRHAIYATSMHFWLKRGIDGFRIDVVNLYSKDIAFPDAEVIDPSQPYQSCFKYVNNGPRMHEFLSEMHDVLSQYKTFDGGPIMTVGELPATPDPNNVRRYVSAARKELDMVFNFEVIGLGKGSQDRTVYKPFTVADFADKQNLWQTFVNNSDAWTTNYLENHDQARSICRYGNDSTESSRVRSGKALAIILATLTGTLFLYQGQEIGMVNIPPEWPIEEYKDVWTVNVIRTLREQNVSDERMKEALASLQRLARDHARTPMQWTSDSPNASFCDANVTPWMRVNDSREIINVQSQQDDPDSLLNFYRKILKFRKERKDTLVYGVFELLQTEGDLFAYAKRDEKGNEVVTVVNMGDKEVKFEDKGGRTLFSNVEEGEMRRGLLGPWEARVLDETNMSTSAR